MECLHIHSNLPQDVSLIYLLNDLMTVINEGSWVLANVSNMKMLGNIHSNLACFLHTRSNSNIVSHNKSLQFNFPFISKFRFDRVHGKMLNDTHLKPTDYLRGTK